MFKQIRTTGMVALAIVLPLMLGACDDTIPNGTVTVKYAPDAARAAHGCDGEQWSLQVLDQEGKKENVGCVSAKTAAKYNAGDAYP